MISFYAHYDPENNVAEELKDHLKIVAESCQDSVFPYVWFNGINEKHLKELMYTIGALHDLGKYTSYFQDYLVHNKKRTEYTSHAFISARFAYDVTKERLSELDLPEDTIRFLAFFTLIVVRFHHQNLCTRVDFPPTPEIKDILNQQAQSLLKNTAIIEKEMSSIIDLSKEKLIKYSELDVFFNDRYIRLAKNLLAQQKYRSDQWYFLLIYLFSILIDRDKLSSAGIEEKTVQKASKTAVEAFLKTQGMNGMAAISIMRENARKSVLETFHNMDDETFLNEKIYTLTAPTGI
ncbi:MAG: CRISPR-associated endonuclease Cas3'', partial [Bacillales bacterium]|nr:CRISPR-associated endonuclease Cas3'' [Bacillales bacterium]